jgi:hypothetical protein
MRELEGERAELGPENITPVESVGDRGEPVGLGRHVDGMTVTGAQCILELGLRSSRPSLLAIRIAASRQQRFVVDVATTNIAGDTATFSDRGKAKRVWSRNGGHDNLRWGIIYLEHNMNIVDRARPNSQQRNL